MFAFAEFKHHQLCNSVHLLVVYVERVEYHFFSDPGPRNDHLSGENLLAEIETRLVFNSHSCSLSLDLHEMSLNIDMKMIRPVKSSGCMLIFDINS